MVSRLVIKYGPWQKAFDKRDGIYENMFLLNSIIKKHKQECKSLKLCYLDMSKDFVSISHHALSALDRRVNILEQRFLNISIAYIIIGYKLK